MPDSATLELFMGKFVIGLLILIRISGLFVAGPFFGSAAIPRKVKIALILIISLILTTAYWAEQPTIEFHLWFMVFLGIKEFMVGAALGFATNLVFYAVRLAGGIIDIDMGYHTSLMFDVNFGTPTLVGELYALAVLMIFMSINGHHFMIESLFLSMRAVPITTFELSEVSIQTIMKIATSILILGVKVAAPILIALFCLNLSLALLARVAPQTNIFIMSFQMKIALGLVVLFVSVPLTVLVSRYGLEQMQTYTLELLMTLNPGRV